jgi:hypothetical protein
LGYDSSVQAVAGSDISFYELESTGIQAAVIDWKAGSWLSPGSISILRSSTIQQAFSVA